MRRQPGSGHAVSNNHLLPSGHYIQPSVASSISSSISSAASSSGPCLHPLMVTSGIPQNITANIITIQRLFNFIVNSKMLYSELTNGRTCKSGQARNFFTSALIFKYSSNCGARAQTIVDRSQAASSVNLKQSNSEFPRRSS